ncbi:MAG: sugar-binding protein [Bacteroidales bacterium]|nr:sugar-binding protein [Bacteroidales bacterium]
MKLRYIFPMFVLLAALGCGEIDNPSEPDGPVNPPEPAKPAWSEPELAFAFPETEKKRYSYCPVILQQENGDRYVYMCANPYADPSASLHDTIIDNVYMFVEHPDGTRTEAKSVLQPGEVYDSHHTCDPSVIQGEFKMGDTVYKYAMFYTTGRNEYDYCELAVAFSNDLNADRWVKYTEGPIVKKTWDTEGDLAWSGGNCWGVGQPSAISLDKKGKVLLAYSIGDLKGTREAYRIIDMSDMSKLDMGTQRSMITNGLKKSDGSQDIASNLDFAVDLDNDRIIMIRDVRPFPKSYPTFIPATMEVMYLSFSGFQQNVGTWKKLAQITPELSGFPRNHNAGFVRDNFGYIDNYRTPTVYFTVSKQSPDVYETAEKMCCWTYDIYKTTYK